MAIELERFSVNAGESNLYAKALHVQTTHQARAYMKSLVNHHYALYGYKYAKNNAGIKSIQWRNICRYAKRTGFPECGLNDLRRLYGMARVI